MEAPSSAWGIARRAFGYVIGSDLVALMVACVLAQLIAPGALGNLGRLFLAFAPHNLSPDDYRAAAATLIVGLALYRFRCRSGKAYGMLEVAAGVFIAFHILEQATGQAPAYANAVFTILGALYVIVRGLDNFYRALAPGSTAVIVWNSLFFGRRGVSSKL